MRKPFLLIIIGSLSIVAVAGGLLLWRYNRAPEKPSNDTTHGGLIPVIEAPPFTLADGAGNDVSLNSLRGKYVVLFFSGGLNCFTCLPQIGELSKDPRLNSNDTVAFSVVPDSASTWQRAKEASASLAQATPLLDTGGKVFQEYRDLNISSLMRQGLHMTHTYFIISRAGTIETVLDDPAMTTRNDVLISLLDRIREIDAGTQ